MSRSSGPGVVVVVAGPDGSGKTAVADALAERFGGPVLRLHHRPQLLPAKTVHTGPVTEPHAGSPYPGWATLLKVAYLYLDYLLGWLLHLRPALRRGTAVVLERGWWDLAVDPRRYRLRPVPVLQPLLRALGSLLPRPRLTAVLHADPELLLARKAELPVQEVRRQIDAWRALPSRPLRARFVDVAAPLDEVVDAIVTDLGWTGAAAARHLDDRHVARVQLARRGQVRWNLPAGPRRVATGFTRLQQPMTPTGLALWFAAGAVARAGGFRLLPRGPQPPAAVTDPLRARLGADTVVAVSRSNHPGRFTVLAMSPQGAARALAKIATDEAGRSQLRREVAGQRLATALPAPLRAPRLLETADDLLLFEPVAWRPRLQPWRLDPAVAAGLGAFHRSGGSRPGTGLAHGDCAPWNLLRTPDGWCLVDWEEATDDAAPFTDVFHFFVQGHALLGRPRTAELLAGLRGEGEVGAAFAAYAAAAQVGLGDARTHLVDYLRRSAGDLDPRRADDRAGMRARRALLEQV